MRVDQLIPAFHRGDAIGDTAFHMRNFLRSRGFTSDIYCLNRDKGLESKSLLFADFPEPDKTDVTILHFALISPLSQRFMQLRSRKALIYHNVTPPEFFEGFNEEMARITLLSREELKALAPHVELALADSEFNRLELVEAGFRNTRVFPLFIDFAKYDRSHSRFLYDLFNDGRTNILFIGRIVPNKKIEDLIRVVFFFKKYISPLVRLIVVGKTSSLPVYYRSLIQMADEFYLKPEEICFTGHISDEEMYALYKVSDVFLSLSEHEGFGLPFIESLVFDLPIIAYDCTAVPFTLGGGGVRIKHKSVAYVAELVHRLSTDSRLKEAVLEGQRNRLREYKNGNLEKELLESLESIIR
ncbi:MAG: glycosyltransferase [Candidatus Aminicenantes bacterium]|nr:glycosyltransferase [Candidatus Aminicenantes bacterium]